MAINQKRYVDITSGVGAATSVNTRELMGRFFTTNSLLATNSSMDFTSADEVGAYFGTDSEEYDRAVFYFGWISKNIVSARTISFARWADEAVAGSILGKPATYALSQFTPISDGGFILTLGDFTYTLSNIDLTSASSLTNVASIVQTAIRANSGGGTDWTSALVTYDALRKSFNLEGGNAGAGQEASGTITLDTNPSYGVKATGTITVTTQPANGDTAVVNGTTITFVTSGADPDENEINIVSNTTTMATNLKNFLNASDDANIAKMVYTSATNAVTATSVLLGTVGNSYTLAVTGSNLNVSGALLTGGVAADTLTVNGTQITFVAAAPTGNEVLVGSVVGATSTSLQQFLATSTDINISLATYATDSNITTVTYKTIGTAGNAFTLAKSSSHISISGANLTGGSSSGIVAISAPLSGTNLAESLGWLTGAVISQGANAQTITEVLTASADASNNFGSFAFLPILTLDEVTEAAVWNNALNLMYMYSVPVMSDNAALWNETLVDVGGVTLTLSITDGEYPEQAPMMILAATDYTKANSVQNYMFQQFDLTPSVTSDSDANTYDALRINYYGQTQTAGVALAFYQRGVMFGLPVSPADQNVYANEIWLKDALAAALMTLLVALSQVAANSQGRSQILAVLQSIITQALLNGVISAGKALSSVQKLYITQITNDNMAWQQVANQGYWVDVQIIPTTVNSVTTYKAVYTLIYSKDDIIRKIEGNDILI